MVNTSSNFVFQLVSLGFDSQNVLNTDWNAFSSEKPIFFSSLTNANIMKPDPL